ncbi:hypothetical protein F5Y19DRAFT_477320 [Xylariaceae sp. FL1651]|nr:hypothetical protein F5Y19DRAFT_477320 [Xylariaceae sp. FL1651]
MLAERLVQHAYPTPSLLGRPFTRLRWLFTRIGSERRDRVCQNDSVLSKPEPGVGSRARSFQEMLGRKLLEAEHAPSDVCHLCLSEILERAFEHGWCFMRWRAEWFVETAMSYVLFDSVRQILQAVY